MKAPFIDDAIANDRNVKDAEVVCSCSAEILWYRVPGTEWTADEATKQMDDAATFYRKYCIQLTFREFTLDPVKDKEAQAQLDQWLNKYRTKVASIPRGQAAPESDLNEIQDDLLHIYKVITDKVDKDRKEEKKKQKGTTPKPADQVPRQLLTVLFTDEWYINTSETGGTRFFRVSAMHPDFWLIGMLRYDRASQNMLTHELAHGLRRKCSLAGRNKKCIEEFIRTNKATQVTLTRWGDHYAGRNQDRAITRPTRTDPFQPESFSPDRALSVNEYLTIQDAGYVGCKEGCPAKEESSGTGDSGNGRKTSEDPRKERRFRFTGVELRHATLLDWSGHLPVRGLAGFDLYRINHAPEGRVPLKLNIAPLPLDGNFYDLTGRSVPLIDDDAVLEMDEVIVSEDGPNLAGNWQDWVDFVAGIDGSPLRPCCGTCAPPVRNVDPDRYLLIGVFESGERDGDHKPEDERCTDEELAKLKDRVKAALEQIKLRGFIEKLVPNPDFVDFDELLKQVAFEYLCGGMRSQAKTTANRAAVEGTNKAKSTIEINGGQCKNLDDETLIALLLHELSHALRNLNGTKVTAAKGGIVDIAFDSVSREIAAFSDVWSRVEDEGIQLTANEKCHEIADAVSEIVEKYEVLAKLVQDSGSQLTDAQKLADSNMRSAGKELLERYKRYLGSLDEPCKNAGGQSMLDVINSLLGGAFR